MLFGAWIICRLPTLRMKSDRTFNASQPHSRSAVGSALSHTKGSTLITDRVPKTASSIAARRKNSRQSFASCFSTSSKAGTVETVERSVALYAADLSRPAFPQHQQSDDCYSTLTDRPDERLNVRFGSIASFGPRADRFRSSPHNGHRQRPPACLKRAKIEHLRPTRLRSSFSETGHRQLTGILRNCRPFATRPTLH